MKVSDPLESPSGSLFHELQGTESSASAEITPDLPPRGMLITLVSKHKLLNTSYQCDMNRQTDTDRQQLTS